MIIPVWLCGLVLALEVPPPNAAETASSHLRKERAAIRATETTQCEALAKRLEAQGKVAAAQDIRRGNEPPPSPTGATRFIPLPELVPAPAKAPAAGEDRETSTSELATIRQAAAKALVALAGRAAKANPPHYALADDCLRAALRRMPDHPEARRLLGYVPHEGGWATPYAVRQRVAGKVAHPTFGWVDAAWVPHLERGELPAPASPGQKTVRWVPAAQADQLHSTWRTRWKIFTEHFVVEADVPFSEAIAFGRQLEVFHDLFFALLADLLTADNRLPLARRFQDPRAVGEPLSPPHVVAYFKDQSEYIETVTRLKGPGYEKSLGVYVPTKPGTGRRAPAYFFRDPDGQLEAAATLYHEVSHQLLFECAGRNAYDKNVGNYWVFEGLGTYFETVVADPSGALLVGGMVGPRIREALVRLLDRHEFVPIERLVAYGQAEFNGDETVGLHYAEAMALAVFLMQARGEEYREPFLDYVKDAYRGRLKGLSGRSLEDRLGQPYADLDAQFLGELKQHRDAAAAGTAPSR